MSEPRVTFLMPMCNNAVTVGETVTSVRGQTLSNWEFIIIDDGSSDDSIAIVNAFHDDRIRIVRNDRTKGIAGALNCGLGIARTEFVARIDADDLCVPERAQRQMQFLEQNPDAALVGAFVQTFGNEPHDTWKYPTDSAAVVATFIFRNALAHPAVMLRRNVFAERDLWYDEAFTRAQDYDLWARCVMTDLKLSNLPEILVHYRLHERQATQTAGAESQRAADAVRARLIEWIGVNASPHELELHANLSWDRITPAVVKSGITWLEKLARANETTGRLDREAFLRVLTGRYVALRKMGAPVSNVFEPFVH